MKYYVRSRLKESTAARRALRAFHRWRSRQTKKARRAGAIILPRGFKLIL